MKNLIIIIGTILLGVIIVNTMVLGDEGSLKEAAGEIVEKGTGSIISSLDFGSMTGGCLIVIIGTVMLGVAIFNMMVGSSDDSLRSVSRNIMIKNIESYQEEGG